MQTEYLAYIQSTGDALLAFEAALSGSSYVHRVTRRWNYQERNSHIRSGTIFVFNERESNVKRWTDGRMWTPSRILRNFLVYRERYAADEARPPSVNSGRRYPTWLVGAIDGPEVRSGGLVKKTIPIVVEGTRYSLVSYYDPEDVLSGRLVRPCNFPGLSCLTIRPAILTCRGMREKVKMYVGSDGVRRPIMEEDETVSVTDLASLIRLPASPTPYDYSSDDEPESPPAQALAISDYAGTHTTALYAPEPRLYPRPQSPIPTGTLAFERATQQRSPMQLRRPRPRVRFSPYGSQYESHSQSTQSLPPSPVASSFSSQDLARSPGTGLTRSYSDSYLDAHIKREPEFVQCAPDEAPAYLTTRGDHVFLSDTMSAITPEMPRLAPNPAPAPAPVYETDFFYSGQFWQSPVADGAFAQQDFYEPTPTSAPWALNDYMPDPLFLPMHA
ncbi:hypothetical protein AURDEDRAFT_158193 [Auricularia subglabra TFB-10046 SS5]|nr:hypothetical protein AURDEDRAFT_158193 [Auricularia subglabra TFB-10046 SS5]